MACLVRCLCCDRAFWLATATAACPTHAAWERRPTGYHQSASHCDGSAQPGYWIGQGDGPLPGSAPHAEP